MDGKQRPKFSALHRAQISFYLTGIKIESARINVGKHRSRPGSHDGAGGSKKTERRSENLISRLNPGRNQRQPQRVGSRRAADRIPYPAKVRNLSLKRLHLKPQNVLL